MLLVFLFLLLLPVPTGQSPNPNPLEILQRVKLNVQAQLAQSANYTCVQTTERKYFLEKHVCTANGPRGKPKEIMRDRLRLDVAVSQGNEIFSWHGEDRFTSSDISAVIPNGPRTSGQFIGFLQNIFLGEGVQFTFKGASQLDGKPVYTFDYVVQLLRSNYFLQGRQAGSKIPYHGSFSVDTASFELVRLNIIGDQVPMNSGICSAETDLEYQLANISGRQSLLPSSFSLKLRSDNDLYTVNHSEYAHCREFRGESTLHFTAVDPLTTVAAPHIVDQPLPAGLDLKASLDSPISDKDSYIGDPVEATLLNPLLVPGTKKPIPQGAALHGIISQMQQHSEGLEYWLVGIKFERLNAGGDSYLMNAWPLPANFAEVGSSFAGDRVLTDEAAQAAARGFWFMDGPHFKLPKHFTRYWRTRDMPKERAPEINGANR